MNSIEAKDLKTENLKFRLTHTSRCKDSPFVLHKLTTSHITADKFSWLATANYSGQFTNFLKQEDINTLIEIFKEKVKNKKFETRLEVYEAVKSIYQKTNIKPPSNKDFICENNYLCKNINIIIVKHHAFWHLRDMNSSSGRNLSSKEAKQFDKDFVPMPFATLKEAKLALFSWLKTYSVEVLKCK